MSDNLYTFENEDYKKAYRHTTSHILAQAVKRLYPGTKLAIGPAIADGFYYDFDTEEPFTPETLEKLEAEMRKIIKEKLPLERFELPREEAVKFMEGLGEPYKAELIRDLPQDAVISFYKQGEFTDLCAGPHVDSTGRIKANAFKLTSATGAYWRGNSDNKMLQRIYGTCFQTRDELDKHLERIEEAKRRDHRKLGRELDLFALFDEGPGFPFFFPKGMVIRNELESYWRELHRKCGYQEIKTPIILNEELWHRSGHWDHYKENMYFTKIDEGDYAVKPMNCPGSMLSYKRRMWSYKDLPMRVGELGLVHRHELSGALHGLMRVRAFTQDDAHIFMTEDQVQDEILGVINKIDSVYKLFGFNYHIELSTCPEDFIGSQEMRNYSESILKEVLDRHGQAYVLNPGDGAFYGPKIDFHLEDAIGRTWQCGTIQLDFQMPERFELEYTGADGAKHRPIMIHTVAFGSLERFIGILTEHFAGAFPLWLAPVQAIVMPITDRSRDYAERVAAALNGKGFRVETDLRNEKIGYKIREAQMQKIPYMLVLGDKEAEDGTVTVRKRAGGDQGAMKLDDFIAAITAEKDTRAV
ncbi:threonyl-tRNA synthetase [Sporobacter termitidis DSM 10068]|uniref:Threonine--tRNA ligase n=2 Tax=Sporobacter TaxID=44748 RepID=A0A1M5VEG4_9FIRM|nr:threonine--tRNA ligase [Sporobacter termitidis]SHH73630.1 threonyl-tRNA synthetase [Sporobacter termitidis DSM 10068]